MDDEPSAKTPPAFVAGQDLSLLSRDELDELMALLKSEITRIEAEVGSRAESHSAAAAFFKR